MKTNQKTIANTKMKNEKPDQQRKPRQTHQKKKMVYTQIKIANKK